MMQYAVTFEINDTSML